jgi:apolipoprotein N-acyltransferase
MNKRFRYGLLLGALSCFVLCAWKMYQLAENEGLWGYWILGFLASGWLSWLMATLPLYVRNKNTRWFGLSTVSGLLFVLGFPNSPVTPAMFIAFVPLLMIADEVAKSDEVNKKRLLMRYTYNAFVIWNIGSTWWVGNAGLAPGMIANLLNSFFMCLPFLLYYIVNQRIAKPFAYAGFISFWLCWEHLHLSWELSWPWLTLGNAFAQYPFVVQWYEYTGVFGGGLWILLMNVLWFEFSKSQISIRRALIPICILLLPILTSYFILFVRKTTMESEPKQSINITAIQPNYEPHYEKFKIPDETQLTRFLSLSQKNITDETNYLIFPETSFGYFDVDNMNEYPIINSLQHLTDSFPNLHLISGLDLYKMYAPSENLPKSVRKTRRGLMEIYNGAVQITKGQDSIPYYKKGKMVPGAEAFPFRWLFGFLEPLFHQFNGTVEGLGTQRERSVFWSKDGKIAVAPLICYESIYGGYCTDYVRKGANVLFIMTNDGWWDDTPGYVQHLKFGTLRAIELRRAIARSANTGSSAFIDKFGTITQSTNYNIPTAISATININNDITFYAQFGDYIAWAAVFLALIILVVFLFSLRKN